MNRSSAGHMLIFLIFPVVLALLAASIVGGLWWYKQRAAPTSQVVSVSGVEDGSAMLAKGVGTKGGGEEATKSGWIAYSPSSGAFMTVVPPGWGHSVRQTSIDLFGGTYLITQVAFDRESEGARNPFGELLGRIELSWIGNGGFGGKTLDDFVVSYYKNADPKIEPMKLGVLSVYKVTHKNCSENGGCVDFIFKEGPVFYILRSLKEQTRVQDVESMMTMLEGWKFRNPD